jgi:hypothetical protein
MRGRECDKFFWDIEEEFDAPHPPSHPNSALAAKRRGDAKAA